MNHFDIYYRPIYEDCWPAVRIALQSPKKNAFLLNNFSDAKKIKHNMQLDDTVDIMEDARKYLQHSGTEYVYCVYFHDVYFLGV